MAFASSYSLLTDISKIYNRDFFDPGHIHNKNDTIKRQIKIKLLSHIEDFESPTYYFYKTKKVYCFDLKIFVIEDERSEVINQKNKELTWRCPGLIADKLKIYLNKMNIDIKDTFGIEIHLLIDYNNVAKNRYKEVSFDIPTELIIESEKTKKEKNIQKEVFK